MSTIDARGIANYLLAKAEIEQRVIDQLQLQKLTYLAHGWHLGLSEKSLITQPVLAWPYGPVIRALYDEFKRFGSGRIEGRAMYFDQLEGWCNYRAELSEYSKNVVDAVWNNYGSMTGGQLVTLTHQPGTPWAEVTRGMRPDQIRDLTIPNELIASYYHNLALRNRERHGEEARVTASA
jgi:uncharacterized phage-associated protein